MLEAQLCDFISAYGRGLFGLGYVVFRIFDPRHLAAFRMEAGDFLDALNQFDPEDMPRPLPSFPADEGSSIFPIGSNGSSDAVFLVVEDGVASDKVLWIGNLSSDAWVSEPGPLTAFLARAIKGQFVPQGQGVSNWLIAPVFEPVLDEA